MRTTDKTPRKAVQLIDIINAWWRTETQLKITVDGVQLFDNIEVYSVFDTYADFFYAPYRVYETHADDLKSYWDNWIQTNGENLKRAFDALYSEYNPIENYEAYEESLDGVRRDGNKTETTPDGTTTTTNTLLQTGVDTVGNGSLTDTNTTVTDYENRKDTTEFTPYNTESGTVGDVTRTGYNEAREYIMKKHGNIGVKTAMDMISSEINGRRNSLLTDFVQRFINRYCFYVS